MKFYFSYCTYNFYLVPFYNFNHFIDVLICSYIILLSSLAMVSFSSLHIFKTIDLKSLSSKLKSAHPQRWFLVIYFFAMRPHLDDSLYTLKFFC